MGQIDIDVDKNGKPDCALHKEKEGKRVHWRCLDSSVTAWEVWFNKNGCPFDSTIFTTLCQTLRAKSLTTTGSR
jgi:hypothetical protein